MLLCLHVVPCLYNDAIQCCWIIFSSAEKFWNTPTKYGPLICSNLLFEHKNAIKHTKVLLFLWPWRYHLIVLLLSVFHLQKGNIFFVQGWVLKCSIFCVRHNTNKMKQGLTMETRPLYDDMRIIIWWYDDPHMISRWWQEVAQMICVQEIFGCNG